MTTTTQRVPGDSASWHDDKAAGYDKQRFTSAEGRFIEPFEEEFILSVIGQYDVRTVLDVPAGTGRLTLPLAERYDVVGADISSDMLAESKRKAEAAGVNNIRWEVCNVADLPFDDESFDAVVTARLFQHLPTDMAPGVIDELMRVIKPGGVLIVQFRSGLYGLVMNFIKYYIMKRCGGVRNRCLFPDQIRPFFKSRPIAKRYGYKFPFSGHLATLVGYGPVASLNRVFSRIPLVRWLGAYMTLVVPVPLPAKPQ